MINQFIKSFKYFGFKWLAHPWTILFLFQVIEEQMFEFSVICDLLLDFEIGEFGEFLFVVEATQMLETIEQLRFTDS